MYRDMIPDVFEIPEPMEQKPRRWLVALVMTGIVIGATLALVVINEVPPCRAADHGHALKPAGIWKAAGDSPTVDNTLP